MILYLWALSGFRWAAGEAPHPPWPGHVPAASAVSPLRGFLA